MQLSVLDAIEVLLAKVLFVVGEEPNYLQTALARPSSPPWDPPQETEAGRLRPSRVVWERSGAASQGSWPWGRALAPWQPGALSKNAG